MNFSEALEVMKARKRVARSGWNGKGMWIYIAELGNLASEHAREQFKEDVGVRVRPCIVLKDAQGMLVPGWLASQTDMLAEDWEIVQ